MKLTPLAFTSVNGATPEIIRAMGTHTAAPIALISVLNPASCPSETLASAKDRGVLRHFHLTLILESTPEEEMALLREQRLLLGHQDEMNIKYATGSLEAWIDMIVHLSQFKSTRQMAADIYRTLVSIGCGLLMIRLERRVGADGLFTAHWGCA